MSTNEVTTQADVVINTHVSLSMVAGAIPIPIVDIIAVTAIQMDMLQQLAKIYQVDFNDDRGKSLASALIGTTIGTSLGRLGASAVKTIPVIGTVLGIGSQVILSGATTYAIGKVFQSHFQNNGTLFDFNVEKMKEKFEEFLKIGQKVAEEKEKTQSKEEILNTLNKLMELKESGVITEEEFDKIKWELLEKIKK